MPLYDHDHDDDESLRARLAEALDGPLHVVIDPLFGVAASAAVRLLGGRGRLVNLGSSASQTALFRSTDLRSHTAAILGYTNNDITIEERGQALLEVLRHTVESGLTVSHDIAPLTEVSAAWSKQAREGRGSAHCAQGRLNIASAGETTGEVHPRQAFPSLARRALLIPQHDDATT